MYLSIMVAGLLTNTLYETVIFLIVSSVMTKSWLTENLRLGRRCCCEMPHFVFHQAQKHKLLTSRIANVRIYVEQAIGRLKQFHILKNILPINYLPLFDDIVQVVCVLTCFQDPLCV